MSFTRAYYQIKPFLPWHLRMALRRFVEKAKLKRFGDVWPISQTAAPPPPGWPGWPEGKKFALVLTHDVEGQKGLDNCRQLAELEMRLGFQSSFNFIPEGEYSTPRELRDFLTAHGFEVGVHDLRHDGKLYNSHSNFSRCARRINHYLKEWNAVGFRSGLMHHNLEWLQELDVLYDASTFDTDFFEPQPDGVDTIFPFWVPAPDLERGALDAESGTSTKPGYIELPYTLPQDSTLFLLFREKTIETWKKKLDWVADRGGMALVNVHPDYLRFEGQPATARNFPTEYYERFLQYARQRYGASIWQVLPKVVATFARNAFDGEARRRLRTESSVLEPEQTLFVSTSGHREAIDSHDEDSRRPKIDAGSISQPATMTAVKSVLMIGYMEYTGDARVIREAEAGLAGGFEVDVIGLRDAVIPNIKEYRGVRLVNVKQFRYQGSGRFRYVLSYLEFFIRCLFKTTFLCLRKRYVAVHVNNMPDFFVFCALLPKLMGAKVLLDIHDPMAETFASKFKSGKKSFFYKLLLWEERLSAAFADGIITVHDPVKDHILVKHGMRPESIEVIANFADEQLFRVQENYVINGALRMIFHGSVIERYGLSNLMLALSKVRNRDRIFMKIIGAGDFSGRLKEMIASLSLGDIVEFENRCYPLRQIPQQLSTFNLGLVPMEISEITEYILPLKLLEYISMGIPPVTVRNTAIGHYFKEGDCFFYKPEQPESLSTLLDYLVEHPDVLKTHREKTLALRPKFLWSTQKEKYIRYLRGLS